MGKWKIPPGGGHTDKRSGICFQNMSGVWREDPEAVMIRREMSMYR